MSKLYGYPEMGRTGLGHSLLAWARCLIWCERHGAEMIAPRWLRIRVGPYLRGERDKREYFKLFTRGGMISWPKRGLILGLSQKICSIDGYFDQDIQAQAFLDKLRAGNRSHVVVFDNALANNEVKFFAEVYGHSDLLRNRFLRMIRPRFLPKNLDSGSIAIHVRMGDFMAVKSAEELVANNARLPVEWYGAVLSELRNRLGVTAHAIVYSDGSDEELSYLLSMPRVTRAPKQESVTDLLSIAQASVLIASGSGFSLWGGYFGQVPTIYYPGRKRVISHDNPDLEIEWQEGSHLPDDFVAAAAKRIGVLSAPEHQSTVST